MPLELAAIAKKLATPNSNLGATLTVEDVQAHGRMFWVTFKGLTQKVKAFESLVGPAKIKAGMEAFCQIKVQRDGTAILQSFGSHDGQPQQPQNPRQESPRPKSPAEVHGPAIASILAAALGSNARTTTSKKALALWAISEYFTALSTLNSTQGSHQS